MSQLKYFFKEFGKYPKIWQLKAVNNISTEQAKKVIQLAKRERLTEFQADNKIQVSARKSTNNNPESKTRGEKR